MCPKIGFIQWRADMIEHNLSTDKILRRVMMTGVHGTRYPFGIQAISKIVFEPDQRPIFWLCELKIYKKRTPVWYSLIQAQTSDLC